MTSSHNVKKSSTEYKGNFEELLLITILITRAKPEEEGGYLAIIPRVAMV